MLVLAFASVLTKSPGSSTANAHPLIAYSCRYYYPAGSSKTSVHQIYVSDLHGNQRRQITFDKSEKTEVQWVGQHKLAWVESEGLSEGETRYGYHLPIEISTDIRLPSKLVTYDLQTDKRRVIARGNFRGPSLRQDRPTLIRGVAVYFQYKTKKKGDGYENRELKTFVLSPKSTKVFPKLSDDSTYIEPKPWSIIKFDKEPVRSDKGFTYHFQDGGGGTDGITQWITFKGRTVLVPVEVEKVWKSRDDLKGWFLC